MTIFRALYFLRMARSSWKSAGGGRHVPGMRSPRIAQEHWLALMCKDLLARCEN